MCGVVHAGRVFGDSPTCPAVAFTPPLVQLSCWQTSEAVVGGGWRHPCCTGPSAPAVVSCRVGRIVVWRSRLCPLGRFDESEQ